MITGMQQQGSGHKMAATRVVWQLRETKALLKSWL